MRYRVTAVCILCAALFALLLGCQSDKTYPLTGQVVGKSVVTWELTVNHKDIPGLMPGMVMAFKVAQPAVVQRVQIGDLITAKLVVADGGKKYLLDHIQVTGHESVANSTTPHLLMPGEHIPDVALINQDGKTIHLSDYRGKTLLVTFIYTRCPLPTFCPRVTSQFASMHRDLAKSAEEYNNTHLLSISFDPKYDTASVLRNYGLAYLDDPSGFKHWEFASTTPSDLRKLATAFGFQYMEDGDQITHTLSTVLIGPDGTVLQSWYGSEWKNSEVLAALREAGKYSSHLQQQSAQVVHGNHQ
ncbi:MAG: SCO family protein [Terriglobales bacterium]